MPLTVNVCIACYKNDPFLKEAIRSCVQQTYPVEVCVYHDNEGIGTGEAFNRAIAMAKGDIIVLLCSDDLFADKHVISDIVAQFDNPEIGHVSRWYHQFVENDRRPVRAWRCENILELANNPSGMAFRKTVLSLEKGLTNRIFVEVAQLVHDVINDGWGYSILRYDTVSVRIHNSISRTPGYYAKRWTSSPVEEWAILGWQSTDFTSLIQIRTNFTWGATLVEVMNFWAINPWNLLRPAFWFFAIVALLTPPALLYRIPEWYRASWGRWTTREVKRYEK